MRNLFVILFLITLTNLVSGFSMVSTRIKSQSAKLSIEMKGRKVPIDQRGQYVKNQRIMEAQAEIMKNKPKDVPIFKVRMYNKDYIRFNLLLINYLIIRFLFDLQLVVSGYLAEILQVINERPL